MRRRFSQLYFCWKKAVSWPKNLEMFIFVALSQKFWRYELQQAQIGSLAKISWKSEQCGKHIIRQLGRYLRYKRDGFHLKSFFFVPDNYTFLVVTSYACLSTCQDLYVKTGQVSPLFLFPCPLSLLLYLPSSLNSNFFFSSTLHLLTPGHLFSTAQVVEKGTLDMFSQLCPNLLCLLLPSNPAHPCRVKPNGANPSKERFDDETNKAATRGISSSFSEACWARLTAKLASSSSFSLFFFLFGDFSLQGRKVNLIWQLSKDEVFNLGRLVLKCERKQRMGTGWKPSIFTSQQFMKWANFAFMKR